MNKIIIRFNVLKDDTYFEVQFDTRLSFIENFNLLQEFSPIEDIENKYILDMRNNVVLNKNKPLKYFNFYQNISLSIL